MFFIFHYFSSFFHDFFSKNIFIGALDPSDQTILVNWYNSLTSTGTLNWNTVNDLCGQTGITCDTSNPYQRVTEMYISFIEKKKTFNSILN